MYEKAQLVFKEPGDMGNILRWLNKSASLRDFLEGASMVLPAQPVAPARHLYKSNDVFANLSDMHTVGRDMRQAMDHVDRDILGKKKVIVNDRSRIG
jgi:hypothetical protein